jgi:PAS domain-containing protein
MAVENAGLYRSLADKMQQYERLKEFSENIVESINVGVLAAGLNDRVESWNSQMERLTGIPRDEALGRPLSELFPANWRATSKRCRAAWMSTNFTESLCGHRCRAIDRIGDAIFPR